MRLRSPIFPSIRSKADLGLKPSALDTSKCTVRSCARRQKSVARRNVLPLEYRRFGLEISHFGGFPDPGRVPEPLPMVTVPARVLPPTAPDQSRQKLPTVRAD